MLEIPQIGLGTWNLRGEECTEVVQLALRLGYRHIDTAHMYENHEAIAQGMQGFNRDSLYITSKVALNEQIDRANPELSIQKACDKALKELETNYLDLYLIHSPDRSFPLERIFMAMNTLVEQRKVNKIGVSNYTIHHLQDLEKTHIVPFANQVEFHPYLNQEELLDYCRRHGIKLISFRPFGKGKLLTEEPLFNTIGAKYKKSGAQVILRWLIQKDIPVIPKAATEHHLVENLEVLDFSLSPEDMRQLDQLNRNKRFCRPEDTEYTY